MNIGRYAASMAELFIVLIVMFLIQALLNFSLSEEVESSKRADLVSLSIRQVPSGADDSDHLVYLGVSSTTSSGDNFWIVNAVRNVPSHGDLRSKINSAGQCVPYVHGTLADVTDNFGERLEDIGIQYSTVSLKNMQTVHIFTWDPTVLEGNPQIKIGIHDCRMESRSDTRAVRKNWNLNITETEYPHPLVVTVDRYTETISTTNSFSYHHNDRFSSVPFNVDNDPSLVGLSFVSFDCGVDGNTRVEMVREITYSLNALP